MNRIILPSSRRSFLATAGASFVAMGATGAFAEQLTRTPRQTEGPFYPDKLPLDTDNDLLIINDAVTPSLGQITHLSGRVLSEAGEPIRGATVEIWQRDANGIYRHSRDRDQTKRDTNFQSFGRFTTATKGDYYFRTIKPVMYGAGGITRTPHIHVAINIKGERKLTTQCYIKGDARNADDLVLKAIKDSAQKASVIIPFVPVKGSAIGELQTRFDVVLGHTPQQA